MTSGFVASAVGVGNIAGSLRAASSLPRLDYADQFTLRTDVSAPPERWARAMFGDEPSPGERFIWAGMLQLRLENTPGSVAGWRISGRGPEWIRLETASWFLGAHLVVRSGGGRVSLGTLLWYAHPFARVWWPPLSLVHRGLVPGVLRGAAARLAG